MSKLRSRHCNRCREDPATWRCPKCGYALCGDCLFSQLDCYDVARKCPGCTDTLPDTDGSGPADWQALGYT